MIELVGRGEQPTAEQVAEHAGVGLRTVYRHFEDMESLYAEMHARVNASIRSLLTPEPPDADLRTRALELVELRTKLFERVAPYRRAAARTQSQMLEEMRARTVRAQRKVLLDWLPELASGDPVLLEGVDAAVSFPTWERLRYEQRLGKARTRKVVELTVLSLLSTAGLVRDA